MPGYFLKIFVKMGFLSVDKAQRSSWKPGGEVFFLSYVGQATLSVRSTDDCESELRGEK